MKGYKVVNYEKWVSLPDIFSTPKEAKDAKKVWKFGKDAVVEFFISKSTGKARVIRD